MQNEKTEFHLKVPRDNRKHVWKNRKTGFHAREESILLQKAIYRLLLTSNCSSFYKSQTVCLKKKKSCVNLNRAGKQHQHISLHT